MTPLSQELDYFDRNRAELLKHYQGKFVVIKGDAMVGAYDDFNAAYAEGVSQYGLEPFLVKEVSDTEPPATMPALYTGLVRLQG